MSMAEPVPGCKRPRPPWELVLCLGVVGGVLACPTAATRPHPAPPVEAVPTPASPQPPQLQRLMQQTLLPLAARGVHVGFVVVDASQGQVLAAHGAESLFTPASTVKLVTTAAVLDALDGELRLSTKLVSAPPDGAGRVEGDVVLVGDGDPSLGSTRFLAGNLDHDRALPWDVLGDAARAMALGGIRQVGGVVADARALGGGQLPPGWAWDDAPFSYSAVPSGLTLHEGLSWMRVVGTPDGPLWTLTPATGLLHPTVVPPQPGARGLNLQPHPTPGAVDVAFEPSTTTPWAEEPISIPDPARFAAEQLDRALRSAGITPAQPPRVATAQSPAPLAYPHTWLTVESPTLRTLCAAANQHSVNLYAETLLMQLGRFSQGDPTTAGGLVTVRAFLQRAGVSRDAYRLVDGSGLSRMNLLAPSHLVAALRAAMARDPSFVDLLSVAGVRGTLRERLVGTPAAGRVYGKSGALTGHRTLVAAVHTLDNRWLLVAVMTAGVVVNRGVVDAAVDQALLGLVTSSSS